MDYLQKIVIAFELQSTDAIKECFENGVGANDLLDGKPLIVSLINQYPRGPKFKECIKVFIAYGLEFPDKMLLAVLLDDGPSLDAQLQINPDGIRTRYSFDCTFTPLFEATLLHVCAEYNHLSAAKILVRHGADINAKAGVDRYGFGGQTPVFHTVNQNENRCIEMLDYLLSQSADLELTVKGLIWGKAIRGKLLFRP